MTTPDFEITEELVTSTIERIKRGLKINGIFTGQFFGVNHEWAAEYPDINYHTRVQAEKLLEGLEVIKFIERDHDSRRADGTPTHWHVFHFIAKRV